MTNRELINELLDNLMKQEVRIVIVNEFGSGVSSLPIEEVDGTSLKFLKNQRREISVANI